MKKVKTFWLGAFGSNAIERFNKKPKSWAGKFWREPAKFFPREHIRDFLRDTGVKLPRKNSKQLIPFHIVPAKGK